MTRLFAVIERDIKKFWRNPVVVIVSLVMPVIYLVILGNSFQGKLKNVPLAIVNQDAGEFSARLVDNLRAIEKGANRTFKILLLSDQKDAVEGVRTGIYKAALIIPADFSKRIILNRRPETGLFLDNTEAISSETVRNFVTAAIRAIRLEYVPIRENPVDIQIRDIYLYRLIDYYQSLVPGVVIMAIFLGTMTAGVFNLVMDRFLGTDESYLLTPITRVEIVSGLVVSGLIITTITASAVFAVSMLITGIPFSMQMGQWVSLLIIIVLTTMALLSMMFVFLGRANHPRIVGVFSGFLNVIFFFPSGAVYPLESLPGWLQAFSKINPEAYAVHALKSVLFKGAGLMVVRYDILFLLAFTVIMMTLAVSTFKRTL
ncbi:MAG: ABC transporter permease [Nitrospiraceae bacterium]|nr:MAG: ABC transporter permease [Nitrospiraceae bacterium]